MKEKENFPKKKGRNFLVTTALEETRANSEDYTTVVLGKWCMLYTHKKYWDSINTILVPYHWDDRKKYSNDYIYISKLHQRILSTLSRGLNSYHNCDYSLRYWRILLGPWLNLFLPVLHDRWESISIAVKNFEIESTIIMTGNNFETTPLSMSHFSALIESDEWNHMIYASILKAMNFKKFEIKKEKFCKKNFLEKIVVKEDHRQKIKNLLSKFSGFFAKNNNFFSSTNLRLFDEIKLQFKLNQFPYLIWDPVMYSDLNLSQSYELNKKREKNYDFNLIMSDFNSANKFEHFLKDIIPKQIPASYAEDYFTLKANAANSFKSENPSSILSQNSLHMNELLKVWTASKIENGSKLILMQHGGYYGQGASLSEEHNIKISNFYLSWGWNKSDSKVLPFGSLRKPKSARNYAHNSRILFVLNMNQRYSTGLFNMPLAGQNLDYLDDQMNFYKSTPKSIRENIHVRLYVHDYKWSVRERWLEMFPNTIFDKKKDFFTSLYSAKLVVCGWNATSYLESMSANVPTVIFWKKKYFELNGKAKSFFSELEKAKIFHKSPLSASKHISNIWENIDEWWNNKEVSAAKNNFLNEYYNKSKSIDDLSDLIRKLVKNEE